LSPKITKLTRKEKAELWVLIEQFHAPGIGHPFWNINIDRYVELLDRYIAEESFVKTMEKGSPSTAT
jgi:predicted AlkP superfamily phosphohydrolase/phosphomutase